MSRTAGAVAVGAVAMTATLAYAGLSANSQLFGRTLIAPRRPDEIALTFDDGPNPAATPALLDILADARARATFFLIGSFVRLQPALARRIHTAGHVIGNHSMTHPRLIWQTARRIRAELAGCNAAIEDVVGAPVSLFRAPHGARRPAVLQIARELGLTPVQWNLIVQDWKLAPAGVLLERIQRGYRRRSRAGYGTNLVLHDGSHHGIGADRRPTLEATRQLLVSHLSTSFVTLDQWL